jgi:hypothetical protein
MTGATSGAGTAYPSSFSGVCVAQSLAFCVMFCWSLFILFFWSLHCLSFDLWLLIVSLVSFDHCIVCPLIYGFWLLVWYLLIIALSVLWFMASDCQFGIFWSLHCLSFDLWLLIVSWVSSNFSYLYWTPRLWVKYQHSHITGIWTTWHKNI